MLVVLTTMGCSLGVDYGKEIRWVRDLPGPDRPAGQHIVLVHTRSVGQVNV